MALPELPGTREALLQRMRDERAALERVLALVPAKRMQTPLLEGSWSVKDAMAHIAAWETMMADWVETTLRGETPDRPASGDDWVDSLNAALYEQHRESALADVRAFFAAAHKRAYQVASAMSEAELFDGERYAWRQGSPLAVLVAANTFWHYPEHREQVERLLG
jgi:hypothetical protein